MFIFRIVYKSYSNSLQATGIRGRWNAEGNKVIYCAESIALAFLENMIRRQGIGFNDDFKIMFIQIPDEALTTSIEVNQLKKGWRESGHCPQCLQLGNQWYEEGKTPLLKVPSAVLPEGFNFVINSLHGDFKKVKLVEVTDLIPDERIEEILKKYSKK